MWILLRHIARVLQRAVAIWVTFFPSGKEFRPICSAPADTHLDSVCGIHAALDGPSTYKVVRDPTRYSRNLVAISPPLPSRCRSPFGAGSVRSPPFSLVHSSGIVSERRRNGGNPSRSPTTFYLRPRKETEVHKSKTQTAMLTFSHPKQSVKRIPHN